MQETLPHKKTQSVINAKEGMLSRGKEIAARLKLNNQILQNSKLVNDGSKNQVIESVKVLHIDNLFLDGYSNTELRSNFAPTYNEVANAETHLDEKTESKEILSAVKSNCIKFIDDKFKNYIESDLEKDLNRSFSGNFNINDKYYIIELFKDFYELLMSQIVLQSTAISMEDFCNKLFNIEPVSSYSHKTFKDLIQTEIPRTRTIKLYAGGEIKQVSELDIIYSLFRSYSLSMLNEFNLLNFFDRSEYCLNEFRPEPELEYLENLKDMISY